MFAIFVAGVLLQKAAILSDPTFLELSKLVGGNWESHPDASSTIHQHFEFGVDGKMIRGAGSVTVGGKTVLYIQPNMGWDPVLKRVTYVDFHNHDTVYMGHIELKDRWMEYDFNEFANPKKHYAAKSRFTGPDAYEFVVGTEVLKMTRVR